MPHCGVEVREQLLRSGSLLQLCRPGDQAQVTRLSVRCLYLLNHLVGPGFCDFYSDSLGCMYLEKPLAK